MPVVNDIAEYWLQMPFVVSVLWYTHCHFEAKGQHHLFPFADALKRFYFGVSLFKKELTDFVFYDYYS